MIDKEALRKMAEAACDAAISNGAEFADVSIDSGRNLKANVEQNSIKSCDATEGGSISIRAIYRGGAGWFSSGKLTIEAAVEAGINAAKLAKIADPDPHFISLPKPAVSYPKIEGMFDPSLARIDIKDIIKYSLDNVDSALAVCSDAVIEGGFSVGYQVSAFANSLGISLTEEDSYIGGHVSVIIRRGDEAGNFYDFDSARVFSDFEPKGIGAKAAEQALKFLNAREVETKRMPVILGPLASRSVFSGIVNNADAEDVQRGRSFMMGKLNEKIASDVVTLIDDPSIPRGLSSRPFDYEGTPSKPLVVMENGVLKSYLYSSYSAGKAGVSSTGHGTRTGGAVSSNIIPKLGDKTGDEIIKSTEEGLYINMGGISPSAVTGDVSSSVDFGFKIKNGELAYPVKSTMVGGKFLDMIKNIDAISSDYREEPGMIMPTLRIQDVLVAGGK